MRHVTASCVLALLTLAVLLPPCTALADIAPYIGYQGVLRDAGGNPVPDDTYALVFRLYDAETGGSELWTELQWVTASGGIIDVLLGTVQTMHMLAFDAPYWLGISVNGEDELVPRTPFATVPYAARAGYADTALEADDDWEISGGDSIAHHGGTVTAGAKLFVYGSEQEQAVVSSSSGHSSAKAISGIISTGGTPTWGRGVYGENTSGDGLGYGGYFEGGGVGVTGQVFPTGSGPSYRAVLANCNGGSGTNHGVWARALGSGTNYGIYAEASGGSVNWAGYFLGDAHVTNTFNAGLKLFKIDHPLDPENSYLQHASIESDEVLNVYNGNVVLDGAGEAWVEMPEWFDALNSDCRYQLTCIGGFAPVYVAEEISGNRFRIAGGEPGMKVSWLVSGVRSDPFTASVGMTAELPKRAEEVGKYMHPEAYGLPRSAGVDYREEELPGE